MRRNTKFSNILFINKSPYARSFYRLLNDLNVIKIAINIFHLRSEGSNLFNESFSKQVISYLFPSEDQ